MKSHILIVLVVTMGLSGLGFALSPGRVVLAEDYTATWCSYCPKAAEALETLGTQFPGRLVIIAYHSDRLGDPFGFTEGVARGDARKVEAFPAVFLDGKQVDLGNGETELAGLISPSLQDRLTMSPSISITLKYEAGKARIGLHNLEDKERTVNVYTAAVSPKVHHGKKDYPHVARALAHIDGVQVFTKTKKNPKITIPFVLQQDWWNEGLDLVAWAEDATSGEVLATMQIEVKEDQLMKTLPSQETDKDKK